MNAKNTKSVYEKRFRKFSVEKFRKILKAWTITTGPLTSPTPLTGHSIDISCSQLNWTQKSSDIKTNEKVRETDKTDKTIELNDSLSSIPETPDFVDKRKALKRDNKKRKPNKRLVSEFIDFESEVVMDSDNSFCDDIEDTQQEMESCSQTLVDDSIILDTQPIGQLLGGIDSRRTKDMHSVYLRSVKDQMIGKSEKYKLQFNYDPNLDVYSQEPTEEELEDYQMDSFCVANDSIESEECSPQTEISLTQTPIESPALQVIKRGGKRFKRIIFSP